ncbi:PAS domain-containing protein [Halothiobacillus sp. DCM-1]|uniref:PAS domain-containing protein n=1 Tax=Halothiobacillus sp. DCM-1 TaxID=3112558 RepID=UPI00324EDE9A
MLDSALLQQAMDAANEGIVIAEQEGSDNILIYANAAFSSLTGYPLDEVLYQDCRFLQADDRDQPALHTIREAIREGRPARVVLRNYRKDGRLFWNELSIRPWIHPEDGRTYFIGIQRDVTELMALREQLEGRQHPTTTQ